jgi:hypothetical protein
MNYTLRGMGKYRYIEVYRAVQVVDAISGDVCSGSQQSTDFIRTLCGESRGIHVNWLLSGAS